MSFVRVFLITPSSYLKKTKKKALVLHQDSIKSTLEILPHFFLRATGVNLDDSIRGSKFAIALPHTTMILDTLLVEEVTVGRLLFSEKAEFRLDIEINIYRRNDQPLRQRFLRPVEQQTKFVMLFA